MPQKRKKCLEVYLSRGELGVKQTLVSKALLEKNMVGMGMVFAKVAKNPCSYATVNVLNTVKTNVSHQVE